MDITNNDEWYATIEQFCANAGVKGNVRYIVGVSHNEEQWAYIKNVLNRDYNFYAYIIHDKDVSIDNISKPKHMHFMAYDIGGTSLLAHNMRFEAVPGKLLIKKARGNGRGYARYLMHMDDNDKYQYPISEVRTNSMDKYKDMISNLSNSNSEFEDYLKVKQGLMTPQEFIEAYQGQIGKLDIYKRLGVYKEITKYGL